MCLKLLLLACLREVVWSFNCHGKLQLVNFHSPEVFVYAQMEAGWGSSVLAQPLRDRGFHVNTGKTNQLQTSLCLGQDYM